MDNIISNVNSIYTNGTYASGTGNSLEDKINNKDLSKATDDELMEVCKDFESYFLEQMLKSMVKMTKVDGDTNLYSSLFGMTDNSDSGMSTLSSYFGDEIVQQVADKMTESNGGKGLGLAQQLYEQMKRNYGVSEV